MGLGGCPQIYSSGANEWIYTRAPLTPGRGKRLTLSIGERQVLGQESQQFQELGVPDKGRGALVTKWKMGSGSLEIGA